MDSIFAKFVFPAPDIVWRPRIEDGAAVYMHGTALHFVTPGSPMEIEMIAEGALRVATLRFDADPTERSHREHPVRAVPAVALRWREAAGGRN